MLFRSIDEIALKFPNLKIICGHIGFPWTQEMIGVAWKHANVFIDTSAYLPKYYPPVRHPDVRCSLSVFLPVMCRN